MHAGVRWQRRLELGVADVCLRLRWPRSAALPRLSSHQIAGPPTRPSLPGAWTKVSSSFER